MKRPTPPNYSSAPLNNGYPGVADSLRTLAAMDRGRTMHGPLSSDARARIFDYLERPTAEHWQQTRNIVVSHPEMRTLWNLAREAGLSGSPTPEQILTMLETLPAQTETETN